MLNAQTVGDLARQCQEQTARYLRAEPSTDLYCLELFRRAIVERSEDAWAAVYRQYESVVRRWFGTKMDAEEGVPAAFERFWRAVDHEKFARFGTLSAVLGYLKMCVQTTAIDHARSQHNLAEQQGLDAAGEVAGSEDVAGAVAEQIDNASLWQRIRATLADEHATLVLYLSYVLDLSPREICSRHPAEFPDVQAVYQAKRNALDRLRRSGLLQPWQA